MSTIKWQDILLVITTIGVAVLLAQVLSDGRLSLEALRGEPGYAFATGTVHCAGGTYEGVSTGNNQGQCQETGNQSDVNDVTTTTGYECDDGKGNSVTVNCLHNAGKGLCETTGSGTCGRFTAN